MRQRILVAMCIAAGSAAIAYAQAQTAPQPAPEARQPDGRQPDGPGRAMRAPLTRADAEKKTSEHFAMLDLNHDGAVTRDELAAVQRVERDKMHAFIQARMTERRDRTFDRLDTNKDGSISRAEFAAAAPPGHGPDGAGAPPPGEGGPGWRGPMEGHRMAARGPMKGPGGAGGPGAFHGPMGGRPMGHGPMIGEHWFEQADANHDNKVTLAEAKASALTRFDRLDTNHDGTIEPDERRMAFRANMGRGRGGPPPGNGPADLG